VADIEKERDWDKEMAEVDRLLKKLPAADPTLGRPSGGERTVRKPAAVPGGGWGGGAAPTARDRIGTWAKVALGVLVAHVVSQILIVWGILLLMREVLPRVGAKAEVLWLCPDVPLPR
jgi:hypothetical protein